MHDTIISAGFYYALASRVSHAFAFVNTKSGPFKINQSTGNVKGPFGYVLISKHSHPGGI